jgi:hypothetical protein
MAKYLNVGSIRFLKGKNREPMTDKSGNQMYEMELDNLALSQLMDMIKEHGKNHLKGLTEEQIDKGQKLKFNDPARIPKLTFLCVHPTHEKVVEFIHLNISKKLEE